MANSAFPSMVVGGGGGLQYDTLSALKAGSAPADGITCYLKSYSNLRDGGDGIFRWSAASTGTDDGGTVVARNAGGTGRWRREGREKGFNVRWFGARGDGVVDDTAAIQRAVDAGVLNGSPNGYVVYFPSGAYLISSTINLAGTANAYNGQFSIKGEPGGTKINGNFNGYLIRRIQAATTAGPNVIRDFTFTNSNTTSGTSGCVSIGGTIGLYVTSCRFQSSGIMFNTSEINTSAPDDTFSVTVKDCTFIGNGSAAATTATGILTHGQTTVTGCDFTVCNIGMDVSGNGHVITGCRFEVNKTGMRFGIRETGVGWTTGGVTVSGISMEANDIFINIQGLDGASISGVSAQGSVNSPAGQSARGIIVGVSTEYDVVFSNIAIGGTYSVNAIEVQSSFPTFINCYCQNGLTPYNDWVFTGRGLNIHQKQLINCVRPGDKPTGVTLRFDTGLPAVNAQTGTSYTVLHNDEDRLVTFSNANPIAVTLPAPNSTWVTDGITRQFTDNWSAIFSNLGAGVVTITSTASTIDGSATMTLNQHESTTIYSNGTNYFSTGQALRRIP